MPTSDGPGCRGRLRYEGERSLRQGPASLSGGAANSTRKIRSSGTRDLGDDNWKQPPCNAATSAWSAGDEPLSATRQVGGVRPPILLPGDAPALAGLVREMAASRTAYRILGAGSNLIVADAGVRTPVISTERLSGGLVREGERVRAGAGVLLPRLVRELTAMGLSGLEFAEGIPLGGAGFA